METERVHQIRNICMTLENNFTVIVAWLIQQTDVLFEYNHAQFLNVMAAHLRQTYYSNITTPSSLMSWLPISREYNH